MDTTDKKDYSRAAAGETACYVDAVDDTRFSAGPIEGKGRGRRDGAAECVLQLDKLAVGYREKVLIGEISFSVFRGEMVTLIGPNGSGKSTILKTVSRLLKALGGRIFLLGRSAEEIPAAEAAKLMASVWTEKPRTEYMTCLDVAASGRFPYTGRTGVLTEEDYAVAERALAAVRMEDLSLRDFNELSDGQKQRVLLAGGLCQEPELLILDEPTSYLDITHKLEVLDMLRERARSGEMAVLMSLHEIDLAMRYSDRIICVKGDRIGYCGTPEELMEQDVLTALYELEPAEASYARELALTGMRARGGNELQSLSVVPAGRKIRKECI